MTARGRLLLVRSAQVRLTAAYEMLSRACADMVALDVGAERPLATTRDAARIVETAQKQVEILLQRIR